MEADFAAAKAMPSNPSNYESKEERQANAILAIVITGYEGNLAEGVKLAGDVGGWSGPHYLIDATTGDVTQLVAEKYVAYVTNVWAVNQICVGIGLVGKNVGAAGWLSDAAYKQLNDLLTAICTRYNIPRDRTRILAQEDVPGSEFIPLGLDWTRLRISPATPPTDTAAAHSLDTALATLPAPEVATTSDAATRLPSVERTNTPRVGLNISTGSVIASDGSSVAIGQNITQNINQTFIQALGDVNLKLKDYHPATQESEILGYQQAAADVITLLRRKGAVAIVGYDGSGKSTLGAKCYYELQRENRNTVMQAGGQMADVPVYWVSAKLLLADSSLISSVNQLVLRDSPTTTFFLVIDDFDYLLDDLGGYKQAMANSIQPLTAWLQQTPRTRSGIIICTRVAPEGLDTYSTPGVDEGSAITWLNKLVGTPPEDPGWVHKAVNEVRCYPGGLEALAAARQQYGTLEEVFNLPSADWWQAVTQFYHLPRNVAEWFTRYTPDIAEQWLLKYLCALYDFASGPDIAAGVRGMAAIGARGPQVLAEVVRKGLVERRSDVNVDNDRGNFRIYDPLRNYIYAAMRADERKQVYTAAANYYTTQLQRRADTTRLSETDSNNLVSAIRYRVRAGDLKSAYALFDQYNAQLELYSQLLNLDRTYQATTLTELLRAERDKLR